MNTSGSKTQPSEPGLQTEVSGLNPRRSRSVENWPFAFSIIDGEVVRNVYRFNVKAFVAAQEDALL